MRRIKWSGFGLMLVAAGCVPSRVEQPAPATARQPAAAVRTATPVGGLSGVIGRDARALEAQFGKPALDIREGTARKLQFASSVCVLDAYLYPPARGGEPVVTHLDARMPDGSDFDRASCIAALTAQRQTR